MIKTLAYDYSAPDANLAASTAILVLAAAPGVAYTLNGFDDFETSRCISPSTTR